MHITCKESSCQGSITETPGPLQSQTTSRSAEGTGSGGPGTTALCRGVGPRIWGMQERVPTFPSLFGVGVGMARDSAGF